MTVESSVNCGGLEFFSLTPRRLQADNAIPVFYNMLMELPAEAEKGTKKGRKGYDVVWIDAKWKGNVFTRSSHSCTPNVCTEVR